mmetsp:Transcript_1941/g.6440  ORF Transcript_1941/g.6440 Transcript_1941/m.6440 type:complete len:219 (-) Transcript_1941:302-958(-)
MHVHLHLRDVADCGPHVRVHTALDAAHLDAGLPIHRQDHVLVPVGLEEVILGPELEDALHPGVRAQELHHLLHGPSHARHVRALARRQVRVNCEEEVGLLLPSREPRLAVGPRLGVDQLAPVDGDRRRARHEVACVAPRLLRLGMCRALKVHALHTHGCRGLLGHVARQGHLAAVSVGSVEEPGQLVSPWHAYSVWLENNGLLGGRRGRGLLSLGLFF